MLAAAFATSGCAVLGGLAGPLGGRSAAPEASTAQEAATGAPSLAVEIEAPAELQALLERHLDLSRLAVLARGERLGESELLRLIDAAPRQARELLQTEGYFEPTVRVQRLSAATREAPERLKVLVAPGPRTLVSQVDLRLPAPSPGLAPPPSDPAQALLPGLQQFWPMKVGTPFRNPTWADAKSATLARLRAAGYLSAA